MDPILRNPYASGCTRWLTGEIHAHVCRSSTGNHYEHGVHASKIYPHADKFGLDFVCMSVEVTHTNGGPGCFGDVGSGLECGVTGIPAREIQNNEYKHYFTEQGASHLHVLTLGSEGGLSLCVHPLYYEVGNKQDGGQWARIRSALLTPDPGGPLNRLRVRSIEIFNGFTLVRVKKDGRVHEYRRYDERCWDDLLVKGRRYWGFAGNDSYFRNSYSFHRFPHLGVVCAAVQSGAARKDILAALDAGEFYSSTGVKLDRNPLTVTSDGGVVRMRARAAAPVNWTAWVHKRVGAAWVLDRVDVANSRHADFEVSGEWKYVRICCKDVKDHWQRAWLQPVINDAYFGK